MWLQASRAKFGLAAESSTEFTVHSTCSGIRNLFQATLDTVGTEPLFVTLRPTSSGNTSLLVGFLD